MLRKLTVSSLGLALGTILAATAVAQDATTFGEKLGFMPVSDLNRAFIGGTGEVSATLDGNVLSINGEFEGLSGAATGVSIHTAPMGQAGPEFATLEVESDKAGSFSGEVELNDEQLQMLQDNSIYVVVKSDRSETGELRAWLVAKNDGQE